jgi:hypothetical protein
VSPQTLTIANGGGIAIPPPFFYEEFIQLFLWGYTNGCFVNSFFIQQDSLSSFFKQN